MGYLEAEDTERHGSMMDALGIISKVITGMQHGEDHVYCQSLHLINGVYSEMGEVDLT